MRRTCPTSLSIAAISQETLHLIKWAYYLKLVIGYLAHRVAAHDVTTPSLRRTHYILSNPQDSVFDRENDVGIRTQIKHYRSQMCVILRSKT